MALLTIATTFIIECTVQCGIAKTDITRRRVPVPTTAVIRCRVQPIIRPQSAAHNRWLKLLAGHPAGHPHAVPVGLAAFQVVNN